MLRRKSKVKPKIANRPAPEKNQVAPPKKPRNESFVEPVVPNVSVVAEIPVIQVEEPKAPEKLVNAKPQIPSISVFQKPSAESILHELQTAKPPKSPKRKPNLYVARRSVPESVSDNGVSDNESTISEAPSNLSTASSRHASRRREVKEKIRLMKKDENGDSLIDTTTFPLGDLIYMSRRSGTKITGIQKRREQREKDRAKQKEEHERNSEIASSVASVKTTSSTRTLETLSKEEITSANKNAFKSISVKTNAAGELILTDKPIIPHPEKEAFDKNNFEHEFEDDADDRELFRRCFHKNKTKRTNRPDKIRRWDDKENILFWEALSRVGQDFSLMEYYFKGKNVIRTKFELKTKFQREDKIHRERVTEILLSASKKSLNPNDFTVVD